MNPLSQSHTDRLLSSLVRRGRLAGERDVDVRVVLVGLGEEEVVGRRHFVVIERIDPFALFGF